MCLCIASCFREIFWLRFKNRTKATELQFVICAMLPNQQERFFALEREKMKSEVDLKGVGVHRMSYNETIYS